MDALIASFMGPTRGPSGADRTQVGPMLAPWTLLSGWVFRWYEAFDSSLITNDQIFESFMDITTSHLMVDCRNITHGEFTKYQINSLERDMHIYVSVNFAIVASDNGMSHIRCQDVIWTNSGLLPIEQSFHSEKLHLKISSAKSWPSTLCLNVFIY